MKQEKLKDMNYKLRNNKGMLLLMLYEFKNILSETMKNRSRSWSLA